MSSPAWFARARRTPPPSSLLVAVLLAALAGPALAGPPQGEAESGGEETSPEKESGEDEETEAGADAEAEAEAEETEPEPARQTPWSKGVSPADQSEAQELLEEGNQLFLESKHREALATYEEALASWDHPAIRFNIVRALIKLDKPVEAYENLEEALRYGADPLDDRVYREALNYRQLLQGQIANLEVSCSQKGVEVTLDGRQFLSCPGRESARVLPGDHAVVGTKKNFLTLTRDVVALPGETERVEVKLVSIDEATVTKRRWARWKPWAVAGGGAALAGLGVLLQLQAQSDMDQYGAELEQQCGEMGCEPGEIPGSTKSLETRARIENGIAVGAIVTGGLVAAAGVGLVFLNQPEQVVPEDQPPQEGPTVVPKVSASSVGIELTGQF